MRHGTAVPVAQHHGGRSCRRPVQEVRDRGGFREAEGGFGEGRGVDEVQPAPQAGLLDRRRRPHPQEAAHQGGDEGEGNIRPCAADQGQDNEPQGQGDHDDPARPACGNRALLLAAGGFPHGGFDQPAPVQRKAGKDVEDADQQVGPDEDVGQDVGHAVQVPVGEREPACAGKDEVRGRAGHRHQDGAAG